jgi:hypothetical protein
MSFTGMGSALTTQALPVAVTEAGTRFPLSSWQQLLHSRYKSWHGCHMVQHKQYSTVDTCRPFQLKHTCMLLGDARV